jgi:hypothetical protein
MPFKVIDNSSSKWAHGFAIVTRFFVSVELHDELVQMRSLSVGVPAVLSLWFDALMSLDSS